MDIRDLFYFETIARLGHLGQAAAELGRTKPALSKCIRRLEDQVRTPLFERTGRRLRLTEAGRTLLDHALRMRVSMADALRHVSEQATGRGGHVRLGLGTSIGETLLPPMARWFRGEAAGLSLGLQVGMNDALRRDLADDRLDGIITTAMPDDDARFMREDWAEDDVVVVARAGHPLDRKGRVDIGAMARFDWVLTGRTVASRQWLDGAFVAQGYAPPRVRVEVGAAQLLPTFLTETDMLSFAPRRSLRAGRLGNGLVELHNPQTTMHRTLSFLYRNGGYVSPALRRLTSVLRAAIDADAVGMAPPRSRSRPASPD
ncbi:LysR family transcriptional regulator [Rhodoplanes roseus]|uniref:LysR family transcriptional regulator n=1 Tax=Rhodoplanes roseus TaxID=29409 RepID=A0A327L4G9_9BRAD|nr:LysR family transcriptional regulator [Rhodoplanes roseus]RAI45950.1 LysR family transcriptional regulator [Rhodoplanes roseus]